MKYIFFVVICSLLNAADDDKQDFRDSDRVFREAQESTGCGKYDRATVEGGRDSSRDKNDGGATSGNPAGTPDRDR